MSALNGKAVTRLREAKGMDQKVFAEHVGISEAVLSRIENDTQQSYKIDIIVKIADALGVPVDMLMDREVQMPDVPEFPSDLRLVLADLAKKDAKIQDQAAAILRGFLSFE